MKELGRSSEAGVERTMERQYPDQQSRHREWGAIHLCSSSCDQRPDERHLSAGRAFPGLQFKEGPLVIAEKAQQCREVEGYTASAVRKQIKGSVE